MQCVTGDMKKVKQWRQEGLDVVYLAAPFFNKRQTALVAKVEDLLNEHGIGTFSPRLQHANGPVKITSQEQAQEIFASDVEALDHCNVLLALYDYLLPEEDQRLRVVGSRTIDDVNYHGTKWWPEASPPLMMPDSGMVWEMGYATAQKDVQIVVYKHNDDEHPVNIMLTQSADGFLYGWDALNEWLGFMMDPEYLQDWKGRME